jgi:hypothetical protein
MARVVDLSVVGRRFVGWWRLSLVRKLFWTIRKAVGFAVGYAFAMGLVLLYNAPEAVQGVADGASPTTLVGPLLEMGLLAVVLAFAVGFAVLVPTVYDSRNAGESGFRFRL